MERDWALPKTPEGAILALGRPGNGTAWKSRDAIYSFEKRTGRGRMNARVSIPIAALAFGAVSTAFAEEPKAAPQPDNPIIGYVFAAGMALIFAAPFLSSAVRMLVAQQLRAVTIVGLLTFIAIPLLLLLFGLI